MSSRIPDTHAEAWALLPWLANGRIVPEDREWLEAHVQGCAECRAELAAQRLVASHVNLEESASPQPVASEEQRSFNKLWARIEASESAATPRHWHHRDRGAGAAFLAHGALVGRRRRGPGHWPRDARPDAEQPHLRRCVS